MTSDVLIEKTQIETNLKNAIAFRIRYRSHDLRGRATESTGLVIAPNTAGTDRRVLSWCHGTTGLGDAACPSAQPDPAGELRTYFEATATQQIDYGIPGAQSFLDQGWILCATDYQGLGTPGMHQYTVNRTNAIDGVTIVHAAQEMGLGAGSKFGAMGWSQGGGSAAAIAELDDADFGDLQLVGTVPMSPGVPIFAVKNPTGIGAAMSGADVSPDGHMVMTLAAHATAFPDDLHIDDVFTSLGKEIIESSWNSLPVHHLSDVVARLYRFKGPILALKKDRIDAWIAAFTESSAGRVKPRCPIFVAIDGFDNGTVVPVAWQTAYVNAIKDLGGDISTKDYPLDDHFSLPVSCVDDAREWLFAKF